MMPSCKMNETKLEVSENYEEAELSDVEDDVFVRGGRRNGYRVEYDIAKKPLMTPRKKLYGFESMKNGGLHTEVRGSSPNVLRVLCMPMCYILIATFAMLGLITVITFLASYISWPLSLFSVWRKGGGSGGGAASPQPGYLPCDNIEVRDVWVQQFPKLLTESAFRLLDVNDDGVSDVVFGYATGVDGYGVPDFVCDIYFNGQSPCLGGVIALDGLDGRELWRHWTEHEVFSVNCNEDINSDGINDCLIGGRAGVFCAISGSDGRLIWSFNNGPVKTPVMNVYTSQYIRDLNGDGIQEVITVHGGDPLSEPGSTNRPGRLMIISGKNGDVLRWLETPDQKESYYSPQILTLPDGSDYVLFGTGSETRGGSLYIISLTDVYKGSTENVRTLYTDQHKGIMTPPIIVDVTGDNVEDIVMAMFNSTVVAFDGISFEQIWNYTFPSSETYTIPTPGFFNEDKIPDFLVKYQYGPGFPVYYHAKTTVLDGATGKPILDNPIIDTIGSQASTPLIKGTGYGNDLFLYWSSNCKGSSGNFSTFSFNQKGTSRRDQSRTDFCKLRFNSKLINQLRVFNRATGLPGTVIYDSELRTVTEYNNTVDTIEEAQTYLRQHPDMWHYFDQRTSNGKSSSGSGSIVDASDIIPQYPASAMLPVSLGVNLDDNIGQYVPGYPSRGAGLYDGTSLSSQAEITENIKYPSYHNIRKHGKFTLASNPSSSLSAAGSEVAGGGGMSNGNGAKDLNINVNRRTHLRSSPEEDPKAESGNLLGVSENEGHNNKLWPNYYGGLNDPTKYQSGFESNVPYEDESSSSIMGRLSKYLPQSMDEVVQNENINNLEHSRTEYLHHPHPRWKREEQQGTTGNYKTASSPNLERTKFAKREINLRDMEGVQRLISTGTLASPINPSEDGIDLIFATYWVFPLQTRTTFPPDLECIQGKMSQEKQRFNTRSRYYGMDHDHYEEAVTNECMQQQEGEDASSPQQGAPLGQDEIQGQQRPDPDEGTSSYGSQSSTYNPFDIRMGQMTVYRLRLTCSCTGLSSTETKVRCAKILPMKDQPWSGYMGSRADSHFLKKVFDASSTNSNKEESKSSGSDSSKKRPMSPTKPA